MLLSKETRCVVCKKRSQLRCGRCRATAYCSKECQVANWTLHKQICVVEMRPLTKAVSSNTWSDFPVAQVHLAFIQRIGSRIQTVKPHNFNVFVVILVDDNSIFESIKLDKDERVYVIWMKNDTTTTLDVSKIVLLRSLGDCCARFTLNIPLNVSNPEPEVALSLLATVTDINFFDADVEPKKRSILYRPSNCAFYSIGGM